MAIFWKAGTKPAKPVKQTATCDKCEPTMATLTPNQAFDTERDALVAWRLFRKNIVATWGKSLWDDLWKTFTCTNGDCKNKKPCGPAPTYIEAGSQLFRAPGQPARWKLYLQVAREIQCVKDAPPPQDVPPQFPDPEPKKGDEEEPKKDDGPGGGEDKEGEGGTPKMMLVAFDELEITPVDDVEIELLTYELPEEPVKPQRKKKG